MFFEEQVDEQMKELVRVNDELIQILNQEQSRKCAKVVFCGDQSHGKTSIIENMLCMNLPRGEGKQTRVPFMFQMRSGEKFTLRIQYTKNTGEIVDREVSSQDLEKQLRQSQIDITGDDSSFSHSIVTLEVQKPGLNTFTIIDLPGMILFNNAQQDLQARQILQQMYEDFLVEENSIICVVASLQNDLENSQTYALTRNLNIDPQKIILCVTKIDIDRERDPKEFMKISKADEILNVFFVRNRKNQEVEEKIDFKQIREREQILFKSQKNLQDIPEQHQGLSRMCQILSSIHQKLILSYLKNNRFNIEKELQQDKNKLQKLDEIYGNTKNYLQKQISIIFQKINNQYQEIYDEIENCNFYERSHFIDKEQKDLNDYIIDFKQFKVSLKYNFHEQSLILSCFQNCEIVLELKTKSIQSQKLNLEKNTKTTFQLKGFEGLINIKIILVRQNIFLGIKEKNKEFQIEMEKRYNTEYFFSNELKQIYQDTFNGTIFMNQLNDSHQSAICEKILRQHFIPTLKNISKKFVKEQEKQIKNIFLKQFQQQFRDFPNILSYFNTLMTSYFNQNLQKLEIQLNSDLKCISLMKTSDPNYEIRIKFVRKYFMLQTNEDKEDLLDNFFIEYYLKGMDLNEYQDYWEEDQKTMLQCIRIWSYWQTIIPKYIDSSSNKLISFMIHEPIQELESKINQKIQEQSEENIQKLTRSDEYLNIRKNLRNKIEKLGQILNYVEILDLDFLEDNLDKRKKEELIQLNKKQKQNYFQIFSNFYVIISQNYLINEFFELKPTRIKLQMYTQLKIFGNFT